jgi:hypothetical protein
MISDHIMKQELFLQKHEADNKCMRHSYGVSFFTTVVMIGLAKMLSNYG